MQREYDIKITTKLPLHHSSSEIDSGITSLHNIYTAKYDINFCSRTHLVCHQYLILFCFLNRYRAPICWALFFYIANIDVPLSSRSSDILPPLDWLSSPSMPTSPPIIPSTPYCSGTLRQTPPTSTSQYVAGDVQSSTVHVH